MKGKGIREERETVIRFDETGEKAIVWTASMPVYRKMLKRGYKATKETDHFAWFAVPKGDIKIPRPKRQQTEKQREASKRAGFRLAHPLE